MIMGDKCTRRCRFCNISTGRPDPLDADEPQRLAETIALMKLSYVVITSVDRDDLPDGGAGHFVQCIARLRSLAPATTIEIQARRPVCDRWRTTGGSDVSMRPKRWLRDRVELGGGQCAVAARDRRRGH